MSQNHSSRESYDPDTPVSDITSGRNGCKHPLETAGVRANRHKTFNFSLEGPEVYGLCEILRKVAVESQHYTDVATAVKFERLIFEQARQQGF